MNKQRLNQILCNFVVDRYFVSEEEQSADADELVAAARAMGIDLITDENPSLVDFVVRVAAAEKRGG
jgi:hypothetical protein